MKLENCFLKFYNKCMLRISPTHLGIVFLKPNSIMKFYIFQSSFQRFKFTLVLCLVNWLCGVRLSRVLEGGKEVKIKGYK